MSAKITVKREARSASATRPVALLSQANDLRQVAVLSKDDFARIQYLLKKQQIEKEAQEQAAQEKEAVRLRSKELVQNWDNTLQRKYQKKLEAREKRLGEQEKERQKVDIEEMRVQAEKRKQALDAAKQKQYYQTDRMKSFHSAFLHTEVLRERDAQLELRKLKGTNSNNMDAYMAEIWERENQAALIKEREAAARRIREARQHSADLRAQIKHRSFERVLTEAEKRKEGEEIERLRLHYAMEQERLKQLEVEEKKILHDDYLQQIDDVRKMREIERQREEDAEDECRLFAAAKRKMMQLRGQREAELTAEKQRELSRIKDKLATQLSTLKNDEQARLDRAVQLAEEKFMRDEQAKKDNRAAMLHEMDMFRKAKEHQLAKQKDEDRERDSEMLKLRLEADRLFQMNEMERRRRNRDESLSLVDYQQRQANVVRDRTLGEKQNELRETALQQRVLQLEEQQFQKYVGKVIEEAKKDGKNVFPMEQVARPRPGVYGLGPQLPGRANYLADEEISQETLDALGNQNDEDLQEKLKKAEKDRKRLGMVW